MEWYEYPNNNRPVMLDIDERGYNLNSIHPNLLNTRVADAYMVYNQAIRPGPDWVRKTTYIPIGSDPALSNSHRYNGDQRRAASIEKDGSPLENNSCRAKRAFITQFCHQELDRAGHICTSRDKDERLRLKHNKWMNCRNIRAAFQNSNCRIGAESSTWVDPNDDGHLKRIKVSANEAKNCVNIYNDPERVASRAFAAGEELPAPAVASSVNAKVRPRVDDDKKASKPAAASSGSVGAKLRPRVDDKRASNPAAAMHAKLRPRVEPPPVVIETEDKKVKKPSSKFKERVAAALVRPNKFLSRRKKSKTKSATKKSKKSKKKSKTKKSKKKSIRRR